MPRAGASRSASITCSTPTARCSRRSTPRWMVRVREPCGSACRSCRACLVRCCSTRSDAGDEAETQGAPHRCPLVERDRSARHRALRRPSERGRRADSIARRPRPGPRHHGVALRVVHSLQRARRLPNHRGPRAPPLRAGAARHPGARISIVVTVLFSAEWSSVPPPSPRLPHVSTKSPWSWAVRGSRSRCSITKPARSGRTAAIAGFTPRAPSRSPCCWRSSAPSMPDASRSTHASTSEIVF